MQRKIIRHEWNFNAYGPEANAEHVRRWSTEKLKRIKVNTDLSFMQQRRFLDEMYAKEKSMPMI